MPCIQSEQLNDHYTWRRVQILLRNLPSCTILDAIIQNRAYDSVGSLCYVQGFPVYDGTSELLASFQPTKGDNAEYATQNDRVAVIYQFRFSCEDLAAITH